ncbi:MAG TPA: SRPBCC family protein [Longimicrobium sp.]|nr:SRPBCC family protein [Longimicrobium sp.]
MSEPSVTHSTFAIERTYAAPPPRVFAAWSDPQQKARWSSCHDDWGTAEYHLDFRIGGRELSRVGPPGGPVQTVEGHFHDIVPQQRIVYSYSIRLDDAPVSVSLVTIEFEADEAGTRLTFTEQGAFFDGHHDPAMREEGTRVGLARLDAVLEVEPATV